MTLNSFFPHVSEEQYSSVSTTAARFDFLKERLVSKDFHHPVVLQM